MAAWRAGFPRPASPGGDTSAQAALCTGMPPSPRLGLRPHLEARTRFFDGQVLAAVGRGVSQVVILGAGYDDRPLRFRTPGVRFFEVDHPTTQADKRHRLERTGADCSGLTLVPADFRVDTVASVLERGGHRDTLPTLVLAEGLLVYLEVDAILGLLGGVRTRSAPGSWLAASLAVHPEGLDSDSVVARANASRRWAGAEPWRTILSAAAHLEVVARSGWSVVASYDDALFGTGAVPGRSLSVVAQPGPDGRPGGGPG